MSSARWRFGREGDRDVDAPKTALWNGRGGRLARHAADRGCARRRQHGQDAGQFRHPARRLRLSRPCVRPGKVPVLQRSGLYAAGGHRRRSAQPADRAAFRPRRHRAPQRLRCRHACTLDAMRTLGPSRARGVAVIDKSTSAGQLDDMAAAGIHGVRLTSEPAGERSPDNAKRTLAAIAEQIKGRGWHIQFNAALPLLVALKDELAALPMPVVLDHFARSKAAAGPHQPGCTVLLALVKSGRAYVKISATYRISD